MFVLGLSSNYADQCAKNALTGKMHSRQANPYNPTESRMLVRDPWNYVAENTVIRCQPRAQRRSVNRSFYYCSSAGDLDHLPIDLRRCSDSSGSSRIAHGWSFALAVSSLNVHWQKYPIGVCQCPELGDLNKAESKSRSTCFRRDGLLAHFELYCQVRYAGGRQVAVSSRGLSYVSCIPRSTARK